MLFLGYDTSRQEGQLFSQASGGCGGLGGGYQYACPYDGGLLYMEQMGMGGGLQLSICGSILGIDAMGGQLGGGLCWLLSLKRSFDCRYINQLKLILSHCSISRSITYLIAMKSVIRKLVAGPKKKTPFNGEELDLTYITDRVIAMAYPASNFFEKTYRNSIDDVASYFNEYHKDKYLIINVSSRPYDYSKFGGRVREYQWPDHQAPPMTTLVEIASEIKQYLGKDRSAVVAVHCNHGKGRTGTAIIAFMLFVSLYDRAAEALAFYNSRRFSSQEYGVDQPCQTRYLGFLQRLLQIQQLPRKVIGYRLVMANQDGLPEKYFISIKKTRTGQILLPRFNIGQHPLKNNQRVLMGDIFMQLFQETWSGAKKIARINYNTFFINPTNELNVKELTVTFKSSQIKCSKGSQANFIIKLWFQFFCLCHVPGSEGIECLCTEQRVEQQKRWGRMCDQLQQVRFLKHSQTHEYFYCQSMKLQKQASRQHQDSLQKSEQIYQLTRNMSNIFEQNKPVVGKVTITDVKRGSKTSSSEDD